MSTKQEPQCLWCNDSGWIAVSTRTGNYRAPGPCPENARGVTDATCYECGAHWVNKRRERKYAETRR